MLRVARGIGWLCGYWCIALVAVGCVKGGGRRAQWTRVHPSTPVEAVRASVPRTNPEVAKEETGSGQAGLKSNHPPAPTAPGEPVAAWTSLDDWARSTLGITPRRITIGGGTAYSLETDLGALILTPATRLASFEGITFWLGYAPVWAENDCLVHEVDLRKNVLPLLARSRSEAAGPRTVVIDAGHGGNNLGTRSVVPGLLEKELTLDWALRLEPLLKRLGWVVVLTRRTDRELSLAERVEVADRCDADLFLSLHFNSAFPRTEQAGLETFCTTPVGLPSTLTRDYEDDVTRAYPNNAHDDDNLRYAVRLHRALLSAGGMADRSVRRARFMGVLRGQQRPAVLLEAGFLSNPEEARRAATPEYRQQLAEAIANALAPMSNLASAAKDERSGVAVGP